jgi:hypothetical protein
VLKRSQHGHDSAHLGLASPRNLLSNVPQNEDTVIHLAQKVMNRAYRKAAEFFFWTCLFSWGLAGVGLG